MQRKPRPECEKEQPTCNMRCLTISILLVMIIQTCIMVTPIYVGARVYTSNKESFEAIHNIKAKDLVRSLNNMPIDQSSIAILNAKKASERVLDMMDQFPIDDNVDIVKTIRNLTHSMDHLLSPQMRASLLKIASKTGRLMGKLTDSEVHDILERIRGAITHTNVNKTMHVIEDADTALKKFDIVLSKFIN